MDPEGICYSLTAIQQCILRYFGVKSQFPLQISILITYFSQFFLFLGSCFLLCISFSNTFSLLYLRGRFESIRNKCHINCNEQSRLTEVNAASAIRETPRIFWNPMVYRRVHNIPPLRISSFSPLFTIPETNRKLPKHKNYSVELAL